MEALLTLDEKKRRQRFYKNRESFDNFSVKPTASIPRPIISGNLSKFFKIVKIPSKSGNNRSSGCSSGTSRGTSGGISKGNSSCASSAATSGKYVIRSNACRRSGGSTSATKSSNLQRIPVSHIGFEFTSNKKNAEKRQQHIVDYNRYDRCKLRKMKALVNTGRVASRPKVSLLEKYELPQETREKYAQIVRPMNDIELKRMMRPKIYYYLEVKDLRPLGRIVIQLFTEACPEVVLEFVRMCMEHNTKMIEFTRLFPLLWIEGELYFKRQTLVESNFEYDMQVMDHGYGPGILSFPKRFCDTGFRNGSINFTLSFMPLALANENRVVFGVVTRGLKVLEALPDYGCTSGKLKKEIIVRKCGMFVW